MSGHYAHLIAQRDAVLSTARMSPSARARAKGESFYQPPAKTHVITVDCSRPEERKIESEAPVVVAGRPPVMSRPRRISIPPRLNLTGHYGRSFSGKPVPDHAAAASKARDIITVFADVFGVEIELLLSPERRKKYSRPRQAAMYLMGKHLRLSQTTIGEIFKRDHTTVTSSNDRVAKLLATDRGFRSTYELATHKLRQLWSAL